MGNIKFWYESQPISDATLERAAKHPYEIRVSYDYPPIPERNYDWSATDENYEPGNPHGHGRTADDAINDLLDQFEEES